MVIPVLGAALWASACGGADDDEDLNLPADAIVWPIGGMTTPVPLSSTFGPRIRLTSDQYDFHRGLDMPVPEGTPVRAMASGEVRIAGDHPDWEDPLVQLIHCDDPVPPPSMDECEIMFYTNYQHLTRARVSEGDKVAAGQVIGSSGSSAAGVPHLHFEIRYGSLWQRSAIHPLAWLPHDDTGPPDVSIDEVNVADASSPEVAVTVTRPPTELDLVRTEVELINVDTGETMSSQRYDANEWNQAYTVDGDPNVNLDDPDFNDVTVEPEPFNTSTEAWVIHVRFRGLSSRVPPDKLRVQARAVDASGNEATTECYPCTQ